MIDPLYLSYMGKGPHRIAHLEPWSCPDAETFITGIDYYDHPRKCRLRMKELYPDLNLGIPESDEPRKKPRIDGNDCTSNQDSHTVRWGDGETATWQHGEAFFHSAEEVFAFSPLEKADFSNWQHVVEYGDYSSEEAIYQRLRKNFPAEWGDKAPEGNSTGSGFYNTMFMWPILTFGWELFLECCMDERFARIMDEFAEINRRVFKAIARLPVNFVTCHDDIVTSRGPVCSPDWMHTYIFPRYEEYWAILKASGKRVIFMADGCMDAYVDDVMACGACGIFTEPYTDFKAIAKRHKDCFLAGEGDNRILTENNPDQIRAMVASMAETGKMSGGYVMSVGNHIPWNIPPVAVKRYLDACNELAFR